ncbi:hypothetical protein NQD34_008344 [Periophthalmus magnuspinnatus]|nr:hypothetical protein NQD34_008344 [Periophthalmus magnuspinnatus]
MGWPPLVPVGCTHSRCLIVDRHILLAVSGGAGVQSCPLYSGLSVYVSDGVTETHPPGLSFLHAPLLVQFAQYARTGPLIPAAPPGICSLQDFNQQVLAHRCTQTRRYVLKAFISGLDVI